MIVNESSRNTDNHHFGRPPVASDNPGTTGHLLDSTRPKRRSGHSPLGVAPQAHPLGGLDEAIGRAAPERPGVLGHKLTRPGQPTGQQQGPTRAEERQAYRHNRNHDEHAERIRRAQGTVDEMATRDRARSKNGAKDYALELGDGYVARAASQNPVERPGIRFDGDGNGYLDGSGVMIHRGNEYPPMPPMAARRTPPDDPFSPSAMRRIPRQPGPVPGTQPMPTAEPSISGSMSGAL